MTRTSRGRRRRALGRPARCSVLLGLLIVALIAPVGTATSYLELTLEEMLDRATFAIYATVVAVDTELRGDEPWTLVTFMPQRDLLNPPDEADIEAAEAPLEPVQLAFLGGSLVEGPTLTVTLMPTFEVGELVIVLAYDADYASPIVGFRQGLWRDGDLGLVDETGRSLSLDDEGDLLLEGPGAGTEALLQALERRLQGAP